MKVRVAARTISTGSMAALVDRDELRQPSNESSGPWMSRQSM